VAQLGLRSLLGELTPLEPGTSSIVCGLKTFAFASLEVHSHCMAPVGLFQPYVNFSVGFRSCMGV
jgi:hypothetical protein